MDIFINYKTQGRTVRGGLFDCNKKTLERRLQAYDPQLYIRWNRAKNNGLGMWELRRRPDRKTPIYYGEFEGHHIFKLQEVEQHMVHHVLDLPVLSEALVEKIKRMDTWANKNFLDDLEEKANRIEQSKREEWRKQMIYELRQDKKYLAAYKEAVLAGYSPTAFFNGIYEKDHENSVYNQKLPK